MASLVSRLALAPIALLVACATTVHDIPSTYVPGDSPEAVVIGRLAVELAGPTAAKRLTFLDGLTHLSLALRNETDGKTYTIVCDEGGPDARFYVALPPGLYSLKTVTMNQLEGSPSGAFSVPSRGIVYIGTLRYKKGDFAESIAISVLGGRTGFAGDWVVEDRSEEAVAAFHEKFPQLGAPVDVSLILLGE